MVTPQNSQFKKIRDCLAGSGSVKPTLELVLHQRAAPLLELGSQFDPEKCVWEK
jgi:hypothetical protein